MTGILITPLWYEITEKLKLRDMRRNGSQLSKGISGGAHRRNGPVYRRQLGRMCPHNRLFMALRGLQRPPRDLEPTGQFYTGSYASEAPGLVAPTIWSRGMKPTKHPGGGEGVSKSILSWNHHMTSQNDPHLGPKVDLGDHVTLKSGNHGYQKTIWDPYDGNGTIGDVWRGLQRV